MSFHLADAWRDPSFLEAAAAGRPRTPAGDRKRVVVQLLEPHEPRVLAVAGLAPSTGRRSAVRPVTTSRSLQERFDGCLLAINGAPRGRHQRSSRRSAEQRLQTKTAGLLGPCAGNFASCVKPLCRSATTVTAQASAGSPDGRRQPERE